MVSLSPEWKTKDNLEEESLSKQEIDSLGLSQNQIIELCFSLFLAYYSSSRMRNYSERINEELIKQARNFSSNGRLNPENLLKLKLNEEIYTFVGDSTCSYFIAKNNPREDDVIKSFLTERIFPSGLRGKPSQNKFCVIKNYYTYNISKALANTKTKLSEFIKKVDFPECTNKGCNNCLNSLNNLSLKPLNSEDVGLLFGGKSLDIKIPFNILKLFLENNSEWYQNNKELEKAYCAVLAYLLNPKQKEIQTITNDEFKAPFYCNEIDVLFIKNNSGIIFEVSMSNELKQKYLQDKINNHYVIKEQLGLDNLKTVVILMNREVDLRNKLMTFRNEIKAHILNNENKFSVVGYNDKFPSLTNESFINEGFNSLRKIFLDFLNKMKKEMEILENNK